MKPNFALNLSHEGIALLHRSPKGDWTDVGEVALDAPKLAESLSFLRSTALALEGKGFYCKLIIPESQILYLKVTAPGPGENQRRGQIAAALVGKTPYDITDLTFDWRMDADASAVEVAVVANETLEEAEGFAVEHRFNPISFVARTETDARHWEPFFGRSDFSYTLLGDDADVRDDGATKQTGAGEAQLDTAGPAFVTSRSATSLAPTERLAERLAERPIARVAARMAIGLTYPAPATAPTPDAQTQAASGAAPHPANASVPAKPRDEPAKTTSRRRGLIFLLVALAVLVLLALLAYWRLAPTTPVTSLDRGPRPTATADQGATGSNLVQPKAQNLPVAIAAAPRSIRPEPRSVYENGADPEAGKPDTAAPVTVFSKRELADISAFGLPAPTPEKPADSATQGKPDPTAATAPTYYPATNILQVIGEMPVPVQPADRTDIYVASIDRALEARDATILPDFKSGPADSAPQKPVPPPGPQVTFKLDARGLVKPTPQGTMTPDGIMVYAGKPAIRPPARPEAAKFLPPNPLRVLKPEPRPAGLQKKAVTFYAQAKLKLARIQTTRPKPRPKSVQDAQSGGNYPPTKLAILKSVKPSYRPAGFRKIVDQTTILIAAASAIKPVATPIKFNGTSNGGAFDSKGFAVGPGRPTRASVAKEATIKNALNPSRLNLIGIYGTPAKRRALLRLPNGRYVKVKVGDRVDGGRVAGIELDRLSLIKRGRNRILKIP